MNKSENEKYKEGIEINQKKKSIENKEKDVCERFSFIKIEHDVKRYCSINWNVVILLMFIIILISFLIAEMKVLIIFEYVLLINIFFSVSFIC